MPFFKLFDTNQSNCMTQMVEFNLNNAHGLVPGSLSLSSGHYTDSITIRLTCYIQCFTNCERRRANKSRTNITVAILEQITSLTITYYIDYVRITSMRLTKIKRKLSMSCVVLVERKLQLVEKFDFFLLRYLCARNQKRTDKNKRCVCTYV